MSEQTPEPQDPKAVARARAVKIAKWAAIIGAALAIICHFLPQDYRALCQALASACTGG